MLFYPALERPEGVSQQDYAAMEDFQQRINAVSLEKVKAYYRKLRYTQRSLQYTPLSAYSLVPRIDSITLSWESYSHSVKQHFF